MSGVGPQCRAGAAADRHVAVRSQADGDRRPSRALALPRTLRVRPGPWTAGSGWPRTAPSRMSVRTSGEQGAGMGHQAAHACAVRCLLRSHSLPRVTVHNRGDVTQSCNVKSTWGKDSFHRPWGESQLGLTLAFPRPKCTHSLPCCGPDNSW